eukprot:1679911-Prymnesium_polylepis.1
MVRPTVITEAVERARLGLRPITSSPRARVCAASGPWWPGGRRRQQPVAAVGTVGAQWAIVMILGARAAVITVAVRRVRARVEADAGSGLKLAQVAQASTQRRRHQTH